MAAEKRDLLLIQFKNPSRWRSRHFDWFASNSLRHEIAIPEGFLAGNPGIYAVHFDSLDDPRIVAYTAEFEHADGKSLQPDAYQMFIMSYPEWLDRHPNWKPEDDYID
jgi:hypothetical protein